MDVSDERASGLRHSRSDRLVVFDVIICGVLDKSGHQVTLKADEAEPWAKIRAKPARCVEAVMRFLLIGGSKESILNAFDMGVVRRYFPEFDEAFPRYLARPGGEPR